MGTGRYNALLSGRHNSDTDPNFDSHNPILISYRKPKEHRKMDATCILKFVVVIVFFLIAVVLYFLGCLYGLRGFIAYIKKSNQEGDFTETANMCLIWGSISILFFLVFQHLFFS